MYDNQENEVDSNQAQKPMDDSTKSHILQSVSTTQVLAELRELRAEIHRVQQQLTGSPVKLWKEWVPV